MSSKELTKFWQQDNKVQAEVLEDMEHVNALIDAIDADENVSLPPGDKCFNCVLPYGV